MTIKLSLLTLFLAALIGLTLYIKLEDNIDTQIIYLPSLPAQKQAIIPEHESIPTIRAINAKNSKIKNFICENVEMKIEGVRVRGFIAYEKEKKFRLRGWFIGILQSDIGSNDQIFWYWSKHLDPPILSYARHEDLMKTRLREPFNPKWMSESLSLDEIDTRDVVILKSGKYWAIKQKRITTLGTMATKVTLIDPEKQQIIGHYLYDDKNTLLASAEIKRWAGSLPEIISIVWHQEEISMLWTFKNPQINTSLSTQNWVMPNMRKKQDIGLHAFTTSHD